MNSFLLVAIIALVIFNFQHFIPDIIALPINILPYFIKILPFIALGVIVFIILNRRKKRNIFNIKKLRNMDTEDEITNTIHPIRQVPRRVDQGTPEGRQRFLLDPKRLNFN